MAVAGGYSQVPHAGVNAQVGNVIQLLCAAADGNAALRSPALAKLQELEEQPGFLPLLFEAYADASADARGRLLAVMMCKNVVDRNWGKREVNGKGISLEEKAQIRSGLLKLLKLAVCGSLPHAGELTVVVRRICRFDFPRLWDELLKFMITELQQVHSMGLSETTLNTIVLLHQILKEQSTKRLLAARKDFFAVGEVLLEPVGAVWVKVFDMMKQQCESAAASDTMWRLSRYLDGSFLLLLTQGVPHLHEVAAGPQMVSLVRDKLAFLLGLLRSQPQLSATCPFFLKNLKSVVKWSALLMKSHPLAFASTLRSRPNHLQMCVEVLQAHAAQKGQPQVRQTFEGLFKAALQFLTMVFNQQVYRNGPQPTHQGAALEAAKICHTELAEFLQQHSVGSLCDLCCGTALSVDAEDLQSWLEDPEDEVLGPGSMTERRQAGDAFIRALAQAPFDAPLIEHIARRMQEELSKPLQAAHPFEVVVQKDTFLMLLSLCQPQLKQHLQFQQLLSFATPIAAATQQLPATSPSLLLPFRLCAVFKTWVGDMPADCMMATLGILSDFMQPARPLAVRLATLGPLRTMLDRFSDHEGWASVQSSMIDSCIALLSRLRMPEVQWRCLNLVHRFLCEEAESGRYEATERTLKQLLALYQHPEQGELLIRHALLDVLRALVLMSCWSKRPRLPLSAPLLECCLTVITDCYGNHMPSESNGSTGIDDTSAALSPTADMSAGSLGDRGHAGATLFESGSILFLGILRTVTLAQAGPLPGFFVQLLKHYGVLPATAMDDHAFGVLVEYCALYASNAQGFAELQTHYPVLLKLCKGMLEAVPDDPKDRRQEQSLQVLQMMIAYAATPESLRQVQEVVEPLFRLWASNASAGAPPSAFRYPLPALLPVFAAWQTKHPQQFKQLADSSGADVAALLVNACRTTRPVVTRVSLLVATLSCVKPGSCSEAFWRDFFMRCDDVIVTAQKAATVTSLMQAMQLVKAALSTKLPAAVRSGGELQCSLLPSDLRRLLRPDSCTVDEAALLQWFFAYCCQALRGICASSGLAMEALLACAPERVQMAFRSAAT
eukprot:TRINITY_DN10493_c0_g3_i1.p1 TRINITY_DN10493_c0_g3~~TRINITY_DN10493_c0_g3_i1.p1  ORF type:complete len:1066 (-),score=247.20 TRINITY_DN10493_c0_g3_i1:6-3203(-)